MQWIAKLGSAQTDIGYGITTDSAGNVYITGQAGNAQVLTAFNADGTIFGSASTSVVGGLNTETFVVKYNSSGVVQWISNMSGGALDEGRGIALDPSSNIYVAGRFSTSEFVPSNAVT